MVEALAAVRGSFADAARVAQGWYIVAKARSIPRGKLKAAVVGPRRVLVYRDSDGLAHVTDNRCPHLGSDLALGRVTGQGIRCAFHGWCWGNTGECTASPGNSPIPKRRLRHYRTEERWGFIWAWLGGAAAFPLPNVPTALRRRRALLPQRVRAHPDTVFANGFDLAHFGASHSIEAATTSLDIHPPWQISHRIEGRLPRRPRIAWAGLGGAPLDATFTQYGGGIVHVEVRRPVENVIVFTIRPDERGHSRTQTIVFVPRRRDIIRALALLWATALDDIPLMESITWTRGFAGADTVLQQYVDFIEAMPAWSRGTVPAEPHGLAAMLREPDHP
jgi:phenylpropionate dioxygenase-like ring-hydroxylating dioxygenase large terminal subunit